MMAAMSSGISCDRSMMRGVVVLVPRVHVGSCSSSKAVVATLVVILCSSCIGLEICMKIFVYRADMLRARRPWEAVKQINESKCRDRQ